MDNSNVDEGFSDSNFKFAYWLPFIVLMGLVSSLVFVTGGYQLLEVKEGLTADGTDVFLKYFLIVVAIERAAAVYVGISRSQNKVDWSLRISRLEELLNKLDKPELPTLRQAYTRENRLIHKLADSKLIEPFELEATEGMTEEAQRDAYFGYLVSVKHAYQFQHARFTSRTNQYVSRIVFFSGIVMAALGLSLFQDVFGDFKVKCDDLTTSAQFFLLRLSDILVTGGLLGGGSAGLNLAATKLGERVSKA